MEDIKIVKEIYGSYLLHKNNKTYRFYEHENKRLFSITTILSNTMSSEKERGLANWRKNVGNLEADKTMLYSQERGTLFHEWMELITENKLNSLAELKKFVNMKELKEKHNKDILIGAAKLAVNIMSFNLICQNRYKKFNKLNDELKRVIDKEQQIGYYWDDIGGGYAGRFDNYSEIVNGKKILIDYKTSKTPKDNYKVHDYFVQVSGYWNAMEHNFGYHIDESWIIMPNDYNQVVQMWIVSKDDKDYYVNELKERTKLFFEKNPEFLNI